MKQTLLATLLLISVGCSGKAVITDTTTVASPAVKETAAGRLILASEDLHGAIALTNPRTRPVGRLTQAEASLQNTSDDRYTVEYRFEWFDGSGFSVPSINTWHRLTLTAGELRHIQSVGKNPEATRFQLTVRLPDDTFIEDSKLND